MELGKDLVRFREGFRRSRKEKALEELNKIEIAIEKQRVLLNRVFPNKFNLSLKSIDSLQKYKKSYQQELRKLLLRKVELEKVLQKSHPGDINERFIPKSVNKDLQRYIADNLGGEAFFAELTLMRKLNNSRSISFGDMLLRLGEWLVPNVIYLIKLHIYPKKISEKHFLKLSKLLHSYDKPINLESAWKRDLLLKKLVEFFVKKLNTPKFKERFRKLAERFPKEKLDEANVTMNEFRQRIRHNRKKLLENLGIHEEFTGIPGLGTEGAFAIYVWRKISLDDLNNTEASFYGIDDPVKYIFDEIKQMRNDEVLIIEKYLQEYNKIVDDFNTKYRPSQTYLADYKILKYNIFYDILRTLDIDSLADALLEIFGKVKSYSEFRKFYKKYRQMALDEILHEHNQSKETKSLEKLAKLGKEIPEETFPGNILFTDAEGHKYKIFTLKTPRQLEYEGHLPNGEERHCIGRDGQNYKKQIKEGKGMAFSIRKNSPAGEICWTIWYDKQSRTIRQIKGSKNIRMTNVTDPSTIATLNALGKLAEVIEIDRIEDLGELNILDNNFLVYDGVEILIKKIKDVKSLRTNEKILFGAVEINLQTTDFELLEQVLETRSKINIKVTKKGLPFLENVSTDRERSWELSNKYMRLIIKYGRGDMANDFLSKIVLDLSFFTIPNFWKIIKMSNGDWLMTLLRSAPSDIFNQNLNDRFAKELSLEEYFKHLETFGKLVDIALTLPNLDNRNLLSYFIKVFAILPIAKSPEYNKNELIQVALKLYLRILKKLSLSDNMRERSIFFVNSNLSDDVRYFREYAKSQNVDITDFNLELEKILRIFLNRQDVAKRAILIINYKLKKLI